MRLSAHDGPYGEKPLVKEYANTNQRVVQVFFAKNSLPGDGLVQQHGHDAADDGANHGNRSVAPVGAALTLDGQNGVGDAGAEVTLSLIPIGRCRRRGLWKSREAPYQYKKEELRDFFKHY